MKFNNCAAWAKGLYKTRDSQSRIWMDLAHCINNDGWTVYTKKDVAVWCLSQFDDEPDFWKRSQSHFGYLDMFNHMDAYLLLNPTLSLEDAIILYFKDCLRFKNISDFEEGGYKPANWVLPLRLQPACYIDYLHREPVFVFAEMQCDAEARIDKTFKDFKNQKPYYNIPEWNENNNFDTIESKLQGKNWFDVVTDLGCEDGCDVHEINGDILALYRTFINLEDNFYIELGRYSYATGYDKTKKYRLYTKKIKNSIYPWYDNKLVKIEEL